MPGGKILEQIKIEYKDIATGDLFPVYIDIFDSSLSRKWLDALNHLLNQNYFLEKNFCFMGWPDYRRDGKYILDQINNTIDLINSKDIGYHIDDYFSLENTITDEPVEGRPERGRNLIHQRTNDLHRYFEDLQGVSGNMSEYYNCSDAETRWHIRQINLLCHEFESWALSYRKQLQAPEWICPSQLMCWLNAPRFVLEDQDYESFGIETISRPTGAVYVGVNKAVGKHHWEVFHDEGRDSRIDELTTSTLKGQTEAGGDFDIEWGRSAEKLANRQKEIKEFREWLLANGFDPEDKSLTLGHPQIGQVNFEKSFGFADPQMIWDTLSKYLDVHSITTSDAKALYEYHWNDSDFAEKQIAIIGK